MASDRPITAFAARRAVQRTYPLPAAGGTTSTKGRCLVRHYQLTLWGTSPVEFADAKRDALRLTSLVNEIRWLLSGSIRTMYAGWADEESLDAACLDAPHLDESEIEREKLLVDGCKKLQEYPDATTFDRAEKLVENLTIGKAVINHGRLSVVETWIDEAALRIHSPVTVCGVAASNAHAIATRLFLDVFDAIEGARGWHLYGLDVRAVRCAWEDICCATMPYVCDATRTELDRLDATIKREWQCAIKIFRKRRMRRKSAGERLTASPQAADVVPDQLVTLLQMAAVVSKSKRTLEKYKRFLPPPVVAGGNGKAAEWRWADVRPILAEHFDRPNLPGVFHIRPFRR